MGTQLFCAVIAITKLFCLCVWLPTQPPFLLAAGSWPAPTLPGVQGPGQLEKPEGTLVSFSSWPTLGQLSSSAPVARVVLGFCLGPPSAPLSRLISHIGPGIPQWLDLPEDSLPLQTLPPGS